MKLPLRALVLGCLGSMVSSCGESSNPHGPDPDTVPPSVAITGPAGGPVSGVVTIQVTATDDRQVAFVQLYINGGLLITDSTAPYDYVWDTTKFANGVYEFTARAVDEAGLATTSAPVTYTF